MMFDSQEASYFGGQLDVDHKKENVSPSKFYHFQSMKIEELCAWTSLQGRTFFASSFNLLRL